MSTPPYSAAFLPAGGMGAGQQAKPGGGSNPASLRPARRLIAPIADADSGGGTGLGVPIRTISPCLIDLQATLDATGAEIPQGGFLNLSFYVVPAIAGGSTVLEKTRGARYSSGPYLYLPDGGDYIICYQIQQSTATPCTSLLFELTENIDSLYALARMDAQNIISTDSTSQAVAAAALDLTPPTSWLTGNSRPANCHVTGCKIYNIGAGAVTVTAGRDATAINGHVLTAGQTLDFPPGNLSLVTLSAFSTAGGQLNITWFFR